MPRSPTMAFAPTPALDHQEQFSFFSDVHRYHSMDHGYNQDVREVRFDDHPVQIPSHGRHSIATSNVPLLPGVSSASHVPKQSFRILNPPQNVDMNAYFENCRNVNEQLRLSHEQERKAWDIERTALKTKIADLEFQLNKSKSGRRLSNEASQVFNPRVPKLDFDSAPSVARQNARHASVPQFHTPQSHPPVWQPESPLPATRVFTHEDDIAHLPSISEDEPSKEMDDISPFTSRENHPIPIQQIDDTLDGITVKSEGVKSSFSKIMSPIIVATPARSPSPRAAQDRNKLTIDGLSALDGLEEKLRKHAGHTPLVFDGTVSATGTLSGLPTPKVEEVQTETDEKPIAPVPTARPPFRPSERSESFFSVRDVQAVAEQKPSSDKSESKTEQDAQFEPEDDKPLTGPLMLDPEGKSQASHVFLDKLDERLNEEVRRSQSTSPQNRSPERGSEANANTGEEDEMPRLRLKKSTNFGSAYGFKMPGQRA